MMFENDRPLHYRQIRSDKVYFASVVDDAYDLESKDLPQIIYEVVMDENPENSQVNSNLNVVQQ